MLPPQPARTGLSAPSGTGEARTLDELRQRIACMQAPVVALDAAGDVPLGVAEIDRALGGGFSRGALHEIAACGEAHIAAATGFALGVAALPLPACGERSDRRSASFDGPGEGDSPYAQTCRDSLSPGLHVLTHMQSDPRSSRGQALFPQAGRGKGKAVVWVAEDMALIESGAPYGPGLDLFGLAPERLLTVAGARAGDVLWTMEEALHCRAVGAVIGEVRGASRELDLVATRRLSLAAAAHGALALLLRTAPGAEASAAATRWIVSSSSPRTRGPITTSRANEREDGGYGFRLSGGALDRNDIGPPRFDLALTRNRRGPLGSWMLEWSVADASFVLAAYPEPVARTPADRPDRAHAA